MKTAADTAMSELLSVH